MSWQQKIAKLLDVKPQDTVPTFNGKNIQESIVPNRFAGLLDVPQQAAPQSPQQSSPAWVSKLAEMAAPNTMNKTETPNMPPNDPLTAQPISTPEPDAPMWNRQAGTGNGITAPPLPADTTLPPTELDFRRGELTRAQNAPIVDKDKGWKGRLKEFALNALTGLGNANPQGGIGGLIGSAIGGGTAGLIDRTANERRDYQQNLARASQNYGIQSQLANDEQGRQLKETQRENILADNELNREKVKDIRDYRTTQAQQKAETEASRRIEKARTELYKGQWYDPTNPLHRAKAVDAGLNPDELPKIDMRRRDRVTVGDTTFERNPETGKLEDSGIPKQSNKSIVDYTVVDPNTGVETTYSTTQEKAASLKQSFANAGMQIKAANERQASQQKWQSGEKEKDRQAQDRRAKAASDLRQNLDNIRRIDNALKSETDFNRRKQLQDERIQAQKDGTILRDQLKDDNP